MYVTFQIINFDEEYPLINDHTESIHTDYSENLSSVI